MVLKLKASARSKKRYLLISGSKKEIEEAIFDYLGILGWAKSSPVFIKEGNMWILAVERKELEKVKSAFAISSNKIEVLKVSGTLQGLKK